MDTHGTIHDPQERRGGKKRWFSGFRFTMLALGLALIGTLALHAGTNTWNTYGSPIGAVMALAFEPGVPTTLFAATWDNGVQESTDGGQTWTAMNNGLPSNNVTSIAINPQNPTTMYAVVAGQGLYISYDGGNSWSTSSSNMNNPYWISWGHAPFIVIDPNNPSVLYVGCDTYYGLGRLIYKSTDGGVSWTGSDAGLSGYCPQCIAIQPGNSNMLFAGIDTGNSNGGLYVSSNAGQSWTQVNGVPNSEICAIAIDPQNTNNIYVGTYSYGVFKSTDGGNTWSAINRGFNTNAPVESLTIDPSDPMRIYAGTGANGVYVSNNGGAGWLQINAGLNSTDIMVVALEPQHPQTVYAGTQDGCCGVTGAVFSNALTFSSLSGAITLGTAQGTGLSNATVTALSGGLSCSAVTASDGTYSISGLPAATYNVVASAPDCTFSPMTQNVSVGANNVTGIDFVATRSCPTITISPPSLPGATTGKAYAQTLTVNGGTSPYSFSVTSGALPAGLTLSFAGVLSGTPTAAASSAFTVEVTDASGCTGDQSYTLTVTCPVIAIAPATLAAGTTGVPYSQQTAASGGAAPYTFSITGGHLPSGLTLYSSGSLVGTPSAEGGFNFTVTAMDHDGCTGTQDYSVTITQGSCPLIVLAPQNLPHAPIGQPYNQALAADGGTPPYTFSVTGGALSSGLSLSSSGLISGTPTSTQTSAFTVTASDSNGCTGSQYYTLTIGCPVITLAPSSLASSAVGVSYIQALSASGGIAPYSYAVTAGTLPSGLVLSSGGTLSGTPTTAGNYSFTVTANDASGCTGSAAYTLTIAPPLVVGTILKMGPPFHLVVRGSNLQSGIHVSINGTPWTNVAWKSTTKLVIKGGASLKAAVPKNTPASFTFVNPDGGSATVANWSW